MNTLKGVNGKFYIMYFTTHTKKCLGPETERTEYYKKLRPPVSHLLFRCGAFLKVKVSVAQSCPTLCVPMDCSLPGSSVHGLSQWEYWSGLPSPLPGDLPNPGIEPGSPTSQADSLPSEPPAFLKSAPFGGGVLAWLLGNCFLGSG